MTSNMLWLGNMQDVYSKKDQRAKGQNMFVDMNTFRKTNRKTFVHQVGEGCFW